jgi:L-Ala-D/L-Glu epimerase / N-acetyl-D-glutamate racemase
MSTAELAIEKGTVEVLRVPYRRAFGISSGTSTHLESLVVRLHAGGVAGTGETVAMTAYTGQTVVGLRDVLESVLLPAVAGADARDVVGLHRTMDAAIRGQRVAKAAVDIAAHDLIGRASGLPVSALLGAAPRPVPGAWVVGLGEPAEVVEDAAAAVARGYRHVKVKGGLVPDRDVALVSLLRKRIGDDVELCMDLNEGYSRAVAGRAVAALRDAGLDLVEQPMPEWDLTGLAELRGRGGVPVMLDESVQSLPAAFAAITAGAADVLNIKILKLGGLAPARAVLDVARAAGVPVKIGTMPELGVATLAAAHLACACPPGTVPGDFVGPLMVDGDPFAGTAFTDDGLVRVPDVPGLGSW